MIIIVIYRNNDFDLIFDLLKYITLRDDAIGGGGGIGSMLHGEFFKNIVQFGAFCGVFCINDDHGI